MTRSQTTNDEAKVSFIALSPVLDVLPVGVEKVQQLVGVDLLRGGEQGDLVPGCHPLQELSDVRPGSNEDLVFMSINLFFPFVTHALAK
jgi:hypothetical protein